MIEPTSDALTTSCRPSSRAKKAMISSGVAEGDVEQAADARTGLGGDRLRGFAHHRGARDDRQRGGAEHQHRVVDVEQLERNRDRDEDAKNEDGARARETLSSAGRKFLGGCAGGSWAARHGAPRLPRSRRVLGGRGQRRVRPPSRSPGRPEPGPRPAGRARMFYPNGPDAGDPRQIGATRRGGIGVVTRFAHGVEPTLSAREPMVRTYAEPPEPTPIWWVPAGSSMIPETARTPCSGSHPPQLRGCSRCSAPG